LLAVVEVELNTAVVVVLVVLDLEQCPMYLPQFQLQLVVVEMDVHLEAVFLVEMDQLAVIALLDPERQQEVEVVLLCQTLQLMG
tara:strand:- start:335 stop:586 length:252 start_codon:yes stop_codon:yes gene_type:complete